MAKTPKPTEARGPTKSEADYGRRNFRFPAGLLADVAAMAAEDHRSVNNFVTLILLERVEAWKSGKGR